MSIPFPQARWPSELSEAGPEGDPSILLSGTAEIGNASHRIMAVRVSRDTLQVDFRADLDEDEDYGELSLETMLEELDFFEDFDRSAIVSLASGDYVVWMIPLGAPRSPGGLSFPAAAH